jgi:hypothetical protein
VVVSAAAIDLALMPDADGLGVDLLVVDLVHDAVDPLAQAIQLGSALLSAACAARVVG